MTSGASRSPLCHKSVSFAVTVIYLVSLEMGQNSGFSHLLVADTDRKKIALYTGSGSLHVQTLHKALLTLVKSKVF